MTRYWKEDRNFSPSLHSMVIKTGVGKMDGESRTHWKEEKYQIETLHERILLEHNGVGERTILKLSLKLRMWECVA